MVKFIDQIAKIRELYLKMKELGGLRLNRAKILLKILSMNPYDGPALQNLKKIIHYLEEKKRAVHSGLFHGNAMD